MDRNLQAQYLQAMGVCLWQQREMQEHVPLVKSCASSSLEGLSWENLQAKVAQCQACSLHKTRTQTVFGVGSHQAELMFVGEAPGANEDRQGLPFVGRAGHLLDAMMQAIGLSRDQVYIANILKCRPPQNRDPSPEEVDTCTPFLQQQITLLRPKLMVALGRISAHFLLKTQTPLNQLRGKQFSYGTEKTPLIVTYHPAYLLRSPLDKRKAYQDLQTLWEKLQK